MEIFNYLEPMSVKRFLKRKRGDAGYGESDYLKYRLYVEDLKDSVAGSEFPLTNKIDMIDSLFDQAKIELGKAGKRNYVPGRGQMEKKMKVFSSYMDGLSTQIPTIRWSVTSSVLYDREDPRKATEYIRDAQDKLAFSEGTTIHLLHPLALRDKASQELVVDEELAHVADRNTLYNIIYDTRNDMRVVASVDERIRRLRDSGTLGEGKLQDQLLKKFESVHDDLNRIVTNIEFRYPVKALREGVPMYLTEKLIDSESLQKSFDHQVREIEEANNTYELFQLKGYEALKAIERKSPETIRKVSKMANDKELFNAAGISIKDTGLEFFYRKWDE